MEEMHIDNEQIFGNLTDPMINVEDYMNNLAHVGVMQEDAVSGVCKIIKGEINQLRLEIVNRLSERIQEWEAKEIDEEKGGPLYTLAMMQAIDIVMGTDSLINVEEAALTEAGVLPNSTDEDINEPPDEDG